MAQQYIQISHRTVLAFGLGAAVALLVLLLVTAAGASVPMTNLLAASPPEVVSYQGTVVVDGSPYNGTGFFKFAFVDTTTGDGSSNYWANDGTGSGQPSQVVPLNVNQGLFDILLGDTSVSGMTTSVSDTVFSNTNSYLRVWFSKQLNGPHEALEPNQRIGSVPYALRATYAETGPAMVPAGAVMFYDATSCPSGWSELTGARGRTVVGLPPGGTLKGTLGTALTDRENRAHNHSVNPPLFTSGSAGSHTHGTGEPSNKGATSVSAGGILIGYGEIDHTHSVNNAGSHKHGVNVPSTTSSNVTTSSVIPYIQLLACKKS